MEANSVAATAACVFQEDLARRFEEEINRKERTKPREPRGLVQVHEFTLEELVGRKTVQLQDAAEALKSADKLHKQAMAELVDAKKKFEEAKQLLKAENENKDESLSKGVMSPGATPAASVERAAGPAGRDAQCE